MVCGHQRETLTLSCKMDNMSKTQCTVVNTIYLKELSMCNDIFYNLSYSVMNTTVWITLHIYFKTFVSYIQNYKFYKNTLKNKLLRLMQYLR